MIVEFSVKNFRSIKDLQTISFAATGLKSPDEYPEVDENNIASDGGMRLLKTVGIYGANASGKSNIIRALEYFLRAIKNEASSESNLNNLCDPFLYQENAEDTESFFQIVFILEDKKYRYGFTSSRNPKYSEKEPNNPNEKISREVIVSEWLYGTKERNLVEIFTRKSMVITKDKLQNNDSIPLLSYEHTLFLTHAAAFDKNGACASIRSYIIGWTISNFDGLERISRIATLTISNKDRVDVFLKILSSFNLKYSDIIVEKDGIKEDSLAISHDKIYLSKYFINKKRENQVIRLNLSSNESSGTQKLFDIIGFLLLAFDLSKSVFIVFDELDSDFHPALLIKLIRLFNDPKINKNNSQLLFTSHDTNLMSPEIMRRDQFYFTEKREDDSTRLYSLADLKGIRNDADFARDYLRGFYGALPVMSTYTENNIAETDGSLGN